MIIHRKVGLEVVYILLYLYRYCIDAANLSHAEWCFKDSVEL